MIKRYVSYIDGDGVLERGQHPNGEFVLYQDYAKEMKEVLEAINGQIKASNPDQLYLANIKIQNILDKHRHYLEEK